MEEKSIFTESVVSDGNIESRITFYTDGAIELSAGKISVSSAQE